VRVPTIAARGRCPPSHRDSGERRCDCHHVAIRVVSSVAPVAFRRRSAAPNDHAWPRTLCATGTVGAATLAFNRAAEQPRWVNDGDWATSFIAGDAR